MKFDKENIIKVLKFQASNHDQNAIDALKIIHDQQETIELNKIFINDQHKALESKREKIEDFGVLIGSLKSSLRCMVDELDPEPYKDEQWYIDTLAMVDDSLHFKWKPTMDDRVRTHGVPMKPTPPPPPPSSPDVRIVREDVQPFKIRNVVKSQVVSLLIRLRLFGKKS